MSFIEDIYWVRERNAWLTHALYVFHGGHCHALVRRITLELMNRGRGGFISGMFYYCFGGNFGMLPLLLLLHA